MVYLISARPKGAGEQGVKTCSPLFVKLFVIAILFAPRLTEAVHAQPGGLSGLSPEGKKLNFVFIIADDLGWTDLGCYGSDLHETPYLDKLAKEGMKFNEFYAASPICSPSRASILTGKYPARLHITTHYENSGDYWRNYGKPRPVGRPLIEPLTVGNLPQSEVTIAEALKGLGYYTAHVGKWHLGNFEHYPENQGFDVNIGGTAWGAPDTYWFPWRGQKFQEQLRYIPGIEWGASDSAYLTDRLTDKAIGIIEQKQDDPFFLYLSYHTPHTPMEAKPELAEYFRKKVKPTMKHRNYVYAAMIASLDENVGRVLETLKRTGIAGRTVVVFLSDNGGRIGKFQDWETVANNAPLRSGKGSLYEGGIRVPLIVKWPGVTSAGSESDFPLLTCDLYPTVMEIAGAAYDRQSAAAGDGTSFASLLKSPSNRLDRDFLYWHYPHYYTTTSPVSAIRKGEWKLLHYYEDGHLELYDLKKDPGETKDLADNDPEMATRLDLALQAWLTEVDAQLPVGNHAYQAGE